MGNLRRKGVRSEEMGGFHIKKKWGDTGVGIRGKEQKGIEALMDVKQFETPGIFTKSEWCEMEDGE